MKAIISAHVNGSNNAVFGRVALASAEDAERFRDSKLARIDAAAFPIGTVVEAYFESTSPERTETVDGKERTYAPTNWFYVTKPEAAAGK